MVALWIINFFAIDDCRPADTSSSMFEVEGAMSLFSMSPDGQYCAVAVDGGFQVWRFDGTKWVSHSTDYTRPPNNSQTIPAFSTVTALAWSDTVNGKLGQAYVGIEQTDKQYLFVAGKNDQAEDIVVFSIQPNFPLQYWSFESIQNKFSYKYNTNKSGGGSPVWQGEVKALAISSLKDINGKYLTESSNEGNSFSPVDWFYVAAAGTKTTATLKTSTADTLIAVWKVKVNKEGMIESITRMEQSYYMPQNYNGSIDILSFAPPRAISTRAYSKQTFNEQLLYAGGEKSWVFKVYEGDINYRNFLIAIYYSITGTSLPNNYDFSDWSSKKMTKAFNTAYWASVKLTDADKTNLTTNGLQKMELFSYFSQDIASSVKSVTWSQNGEYCFVGCADGRVRAYKHNDEVNKIANAFIFTNFALASAFDDKGYLVTAADKPVVNLCWTKDGTALIAGSKAQVDTTTNYVTFRLSMAEEKFEKVGPTGSLTGNLALINQVDNKIITYESTSSWKELKDQWGFWEVPDNYDRALDPWKIARNIQMSPKIPGDYNSGSGYVAKAAMYKREQVPGAKVSAISKLDVPAIASVQFTEAPVVATEYINLDPIRDFSWSPDGTSVAIAAPIAKGKFDFTVYELGADKKLTELTWARKMLGDSVNNLYCQAVSFSPDGKIIVCGGPGKLVLFAFDKSAKTFTEIPVAGDVLNLGGVRLIDWAQKDGRTFFVAASGNRIRVFKLTGVGAAATIEQEGQEIQTHTMYSGYSGASVDNGVISSISMRLPKRGNSSILVAATALFEDKSSLKIFSPQVFNNNSNTLLTATLGHLDLVADKTTQPGTTINKIKPTFAAWGRSDDDSDYLVLTEGNYYGVFKIKTTDITNAIGSYVRTDETGVEKISADNLQISDLSSDLTHVEWVSSPAGYLIFGCNVTGTTLESKLSLYKFNPGFDAATGEWAMGKTALTKVDVTFANTLAWSKLKFIKNMTMIGASGARRSVAGQTDAQETFRTYTTAELAAKLSSSKSIYEEIRSKKSGAELASIAALQTKLDGIVRGIASSKPVADFTNDANALKGSIDSINRMAQSVTDANLTDLPKANDVDALISNYQRSFDANKLSTPEVQLNYSVTDYTSTLGKDGKTVVSGSVKGASAKVKLLDAQTDANALTAIKFNIPGIADMVSDNDLSQKSLLQLCIDCANTKANAVDIAGAQVYEKFFSDNISTAQAPQQAVSDVLGQLGTYQTKTSEILNEITPKYNAAMGSELARMQSKAAELSLTINGQLLADQATVLVKKANDAVVAVTSLAQTDPRPNNFVNTINALMPAVANANNDIQGIVTLFNNQKAAIASATVVQIEDARKNFAAMNAAINQSDSANKLQALATAVNAVTAQQTTIVQQIQANIASLGIEQLITSAKAMYEGASGLSAKYTALNARFATTFKTSTDQLAPLQKQLNDLKLAATDAGLVVAQGMISAINTLVTTINTAKTNLDQAYADVTMNEAAVLGATSVAAAQDANTKMLTAKVKFDTNYSVITTGIDTDLPAKITDLQTKITQLSAVSVTPQVVAQSGDKGISGDKVVPPADTGAKASDATTTDTGAKKPDVTTTDTGAKASDTKTKADTALLTSANVPLDITTLSEGTYVRLRVGTDYLKLDNGKLVKATSKANATSFIASLPSSSTLQLASAANLINLSIVDVPLTLNQNQLRPSESSSYVSVQTYSTALPAISAFGFEADDQFNNQLSVVLNSQARAYFKLFDNGTVGVFNPDFKPVSKAQASLIVIEAFK